MLSKHRFSIISVHLGYNLSYKQATIIYQLQENPKGYHITSSPHRPSDKLQQTQHMFTEWNQGKGTDKPDPVTTVMKISRAKTKSTWQRQSTKSLNCIPLAQRYDVILSDAIHIFQLQRYNISPLPLKIRLIKNGKKLRCNSIKVGIFEKGPSSS